MPRAAQFFEEPTPAQKGRAGSFDGSLNRYVKYALKQSPRLQGAWHHYRSSVDEARGAGAPPEPTISYAFFLRPVETRVGPQQHKIGISQAFPWPGRLGGKQSAADALARAARKRFEALGFDIARNVRDAYWELWLVEQLRRVKRDQVSLLGQLAASARARLEIGRASVADVGQIELMRSRLVDERAALSERGHQARARLRAALGVGFGTKLPVAAELAPRVQPSEGERSLQQAASDHPRVTQFSELAESQRERARSARAAGLPGFRVGAEYIVTGEANNPGMKDSGKDPVILMLSAQVPLWRGSYDAQESAARAEARSLSSQQQSLALEARAQVTTLLSKLRDQRRRLELYERTLLPQALAVFESTLGAYQTEKSGIAAVLLAVRQLLDIELMVVETEASGARTIAALEAVVGRKIKTRSLARPKATP